MKSIENDLDERQLMNKIQISDITFTDYLFRFISNITWNLKEKQANI